MADITRDRVTRALADYLPHSPASENIEDRRGDDPRTTALGIWAQSMSRYPSTNVLLKRRDMKEAEEISNMFRRRSE